MNAMPNLTAAPQPAMTAVATLAEVQAEIETMFSVCVASDMDKSIANETAKKARASYGTTRLDMFERAANVAHNNRWSAGTVKTAMEKAIDVRYKGENNKDARKTAKNVAKIIQHVTHEKVRPHFSVWLSAIKSAFDTEAYDAELDRKAGGAGATPIKKAFSRVELFLMKHYVNPVALDGRAPGPVKYEEIVEYAHAHDPALDAERAEKDLKKMVRQLRDFHGDFPVDVINLAIEALEGINAEELAAARTIMIEGLVATGVAAETERDDGETGNEPVNGLIDPDDIMSDMPSSRMAMAAD